MPAPPKRVVVLANCASGAGGAIEERTRLVKEAFAATGVVPEVRCVVGADVERVARQLAAERPDALVAAGGDGTVSAVAGAVVESDVPMGVLPLGTLNHFAKDLGIPLDAAEAAAVVAAGAWIRVDAARVNDRTFVNNSSLGLYPNFVRARDALRAERGTSKRAATLRTSLDALRRLPLARFRLVVDGRSETVHTPLLFIGNDPYALDGLSMGKRPSLQRGRLAVVHTRRTHGIGLALLALRALAGRIDGARDLTMEEATSVRVEAARGELRVALDGEVFTLRPPLEYRTLPGALKVLVPGGGDAA